MKFLPFLLLSVLVVTDTRAQHYYNDILSNQSSNDQYRLLKQSGVRSITGVSYEADNSKTDNFLLQQEFSRDRKVLTTSATNTNNITMVTTSYYENDRLVRTSDSLTSLGNVTTTVEYYYTPEGKLSRIASTSTDRDHNGNTSEVHQWFYKPGGLPDYMLKIKNGTDTVRVEFSFDDKGNVAEEYWKAKGRLLNTYYYYYNSDNQLTDVVRYNTRVKKLLPDFLLEYTDGRLSQLMQTISGTTNYLVWKYNYNEKGLKKTEQLYDKNKQMVGRIEYTYSY